MPTGYLLPVATRPKFNVRNTFTWRLRAATVLINIQFNLYAHGQQILVCILKGNCLKKFGKHPRKISS